MLVPKIGCIGPVRECGLRKKNDKNSFFNFIFIVLQCFSRRCLIREVRVVGEHIL